MSKKNISILVIIAFILVSILAILFYFYGKNFSLFFNIGKTAKVEMAINSLVNEIPSLDNSQIRIKLGEISGYLPFSYQGQNITTKDDILRIIAKKLLLKDDYENVNAFEMSVGKFIFSGYFASTIISDDYKKIDNYSYYNKFKDQCPNMLKYNLTNYEIDNFRANTSSNKNGIYDDFYACLSTLDINICDNLNVEETVNGVKVKLDQEACQLQVGSNLLNYFYFFSKISCDKIDFTRVNSKCSGQQPSCGKACEIFRRLSTNLEGFAPLEKLRLQAFIDKNINSCDLINNYTGLETNDITECKKDVALWLANENKDIAKIKEIDQEQANISSKRLFNEYLIQNFETISKKLDDQVLNGSYNFIFETEDIANYCINSYKSIFTKICDNSINMIEDWFKVVAGL